MSEEQNESASFVYAARVKDVFKKQDLRCAGDTLDALNKKIEGFLLDAARRCKGNGRMTVKPDDL